MGFRASEKYGVNPSVDTCFICGKETNVVLFGASYKDENGKTVEAPRKVCTGQLCDDCQKVIDEGGIFFIAVKDGEFGNCPWRTGQIGTLKEEAVQKMFQIFLIRRLIILKKVLINKYLKVKLFKVIKVWKLLNLKLSFGFKMTQLLM